VRNETAVPAATAALRILSYLAAQRGPQGAATIAAHLGLPRSSVYKLLAALEGEGFVLHFPEARRYGIGIAAFELSSGFSRQEPLARLGRPILAALVDRLGESAHLAVLHGRDVLYLIEERAPRRPALVSDVGVRLPAHLAASGRAMLAELPAAQVRALFPDAEAFVHRRIVGEIAAYGALKRELADTRGRGYAFEDGAITPGIASVAVAVLDHAGWPAASIAVTFAAVDVDAERSTAIATELRQYASELARRISGREPR